MDTDIDSGFEIVALVVHRDSDDAVRLRNATVIRHIAYAPKRTGVPGWNMYVKRLKYDVNSHVWNSSNLIDENVTITWSLDDYMDRSDSRTLRNHSNEFHDMMKSIGP